MNWSKYLIIVLLFYLLALLQNSFFAHFDLLGAVPNLVFIFFFTLTFFNEKNYLQIIFPALSAGFFLDIFSASYFFGFSIILLIILGLLLKKIQSLLKNRQDQYPFIYFASLFLIFWLVFQLPMGRETVVAAFYNLAVACAFFYIYKRMAVNGKNL